MNLPFRLPPALRSLVFALLLLPGWTSPALGQGTQIKGPDIMKHPIGPLAVQYVELVQSGRMEDAIKLSSNKEQAEWKKYPSERTATANFMKKMMPSPADLQASLKGSAILVVEGNRATLNVIKIEPQAGAPGNVTTTSSTVGMPFVLEGGKWKFGK